MWVIDIHHWLDDTLSRPAVPRLKSKVEHLGRIIAYATAALAGRPIDIRPPCWRRPGRKPCRGKLEIGFDENEERILWRCPICGDEGVISGWQQTLWDLTDGTEIEH